MEDRVVQYPTRFKLTAVAGVADTYDLEAVPGEVTSEGTPISKASLLDATTTTLLGLTDAPATPKDALQRIVQSSVVTLAAGEWIGSSAPFSQTETVDWMKSTFTPQVDLVPNASYLAAQEEEYCWSQIHKAVSSNGSITFYMHEKPTVNLSVRVKGV